MGTTPGGSKEKFNKVKLKVDSTPNEKHKSRSQRDKRIKRS